MKNKVIKIIRGFLIKYKNMPVQIKASAWFLICSFMQKGISMISTPIFTRLLTTEEYGQYSVFDSWMGIITIFVTLNIGSGIYTQGLIKFEERRQEFASSLQGLTTTLILLWSIIYFIFMKFWNNLFSLSTIQVVAMFLMIWSTSMWGFWAAGQRVDYNYVQLVILSIVASIAKPLVGIIFVLLAEDKVTARIVGLALVEMLVYTRLFFQQMKSGKKFFEKNFWRYALILCVPLLPHYLSQIILGSSDRIMIREMVGTEAAGIYSLAYSVSMIMTLFNTALSQTITPWMYRKIKEKQVESIGNITYISLGVIAVLNLLLIMFAPELVAIFAPKEYYDAIWIIPPVAMSSFFIFSYDFFARFEFYYEKTKFIAFASILGAILNLILNYIFIGLFGYYAAGYTTLVCYIVYVICHYLGMREICKKYLNNAKVYDFKILIGISSGFMCCGFILLVTYNYSMIRYAIAIISMIILMGLNKQIIKIIKQLLALKRR